MYNVVEHVVSDLLRKDIVRYTVGAHVVKFFSPDTAGDRLSQKLLTSTTFMATIVSIIRRHPDTSIEQKNGTTFAKTDPIDTVEMFNDFANSPASLSDCRTDE